MLGHPLPQFAVNDDAAVTLSDFVSIQSDLGHVVAACRWLVEHLPVAEEEVANPTGAVLTRCVWESAVISYGRCFHSGKGHLPQGEPYALPRELTDQFPVEHREAHDPVMEERDRHVAHRVDRRQQAQALIALTDPPDHPAVAKVMPMIVHQVVDRALPGRLMALAAHLAEQMKPRIAAQRDSVATDWNSRLDEAYATAKRETSTIDVGESGSGGSVVTVVLFDV